LIGDLVEKFQSIHNEEIGKKLLVVVMAEPSSSHIDQKDRDPTPGIPPLISRSILPIVKGQWEIVHATPT
jgi:hypothetical protein